MSPAISHSRLKAARCRNEPYWNGKETAKEWHRGNVSVGSTLSAETRMLGCSMELLSHFRTRIPRPITTRRKSTRKVSEFLEPTLELTSEWDWVME